MTEIKEMWTAVYGENTDFNWVGRVIALPFVVVLTAIFLLVYKWR